MMVMGIQAAGSVCSVCGKDISGKYGISVSDQGDYCTSCVERKMNWVRGNGNGDEPSKVVTILAENIALRDIIKYGISEVVDMEPYIDRAARELGVRKIRAGDII